MASRIEKGGGDRDVEIGLAPPSPSPSASPSVRKLVFSYSAKRMDQEAVASPSASPAKPALVLSNSGKRMDQGSSPSLVLCNSGKRMDQGSSHSLVLSNSGKRMDSSGKKKYVRQVTGRHNDTELHLAAQRGDLWAVRQILGEIDAQMTGTALGADFDAEVAEIRAAVVNDVNEEDETALFTAAEKGFLDVVAELLKYSERENLTRKNRSGFDVFHVAARQGHQGEEGCHY